MQTVLVCMIVSGLMPTNDIFPFSKREAPAKDSMADICPVKYRPYRVTPMFGPMYYVNLEFSCNNHRLFLLLARRRHKSIRKK